MLAAISLEQSQAQESPAERLRKRILGQSKGIEKTPGLIAHYDFRSLPPIELGAGARLENGQLQLNGEYSDYKTEFYLSSHGMRANESFTVSYNFKPEAFDTYKYGNLLSFGRSSRWLSASRHQETGALRIAFRNGEKYREYENTEIEVGQWYNLTIILNAEKQQIETYINGHSLAPINLGAYLREGNNPYIDFSFCNFGNGSVFHGVIEDLAFFNTALSPAEFASFYPKMIASVPGNMPPALNKYQSEQFGEFRYELEEEWTYLPACVEGDKAKSLEVSCPDGKKVRFGLTHIENEDVYIIRRNSFSSVGGFRFKSFDACLKKALEIAKDDC